MKQVVVTGVSSGIGRAASLHLAAHGYHVFGSVRRDSDAASLQADLGDRFTPLLFDVTDEPAVRAAAAQVEESLAGRALDGLVNNAGVAVPGPLQHLPLADFRRQLEVNVVGALAVTQAFLPLLGARPGFTRRPGRIVNISSVSGKIVYPFLVPYAVSKHALEALSDGLRRELRLYGIDVVVVEPGSVRTPIWDKAAGEDARFDATDYAPILRRMQATFVRQGQAGMPVEKIAATIRVALEAHRPKSRYPIPRRWLTGWLVPRLLPDRWLDWLTARRLGIPRRGPR